MNLRADAPPPATEPTPVNSERRPSRRLPWKWRALFWLFLLSSVCFCALMALRWAGSTELRGTVERVYEKQAEYRVEFTELDGTVHVVGNQEIHFPFFKVDTADVQAELNRLARTKDIVDLKIWGLRIPWFSLFPNIVDVEFVRSDSDRRRAQATEITEAVLRTLRNQGIIRGGEDVREALIKTIEESLNPNASSKKDEASSHPANSDFVAP